MEINFQNGSKITLLDDYKGEGAIRGNSHKRFFGHTKEKLEVNFVLREDLQKIDSQGIGYVYKSTKHPTADDLMVVHFEEDGAWQTVNYTKKVFEEKIKDGYWI